jgi:hypothetical protein
MFVEAILIQAGVALDLAFALLSEEPLCHLNAPF